LGVIFLFKRRQIFGRLCLLRLTFNINRHFNILL
jgi:hypothetical protein